MNEFEWHGVKFQRCLGDTYFSRNTPNAVMHSACVWQEPSGAWMASIIPNEMFSARSGHRASQGATPQEALDGEVAMWLMSVLCLPGATDRVAKYFQANRIAIEVREVAADPRSSPE